MITRKSQQFVGLRPPMYRTFLAGKHNAHSMNILVNSQLHCDFTTPTGSKCCFICFRLAVICRENLGIRGVLRGPGFVPIGAHPRRPSTFQYKDLLYLPLFVWPGLQCKIMPPPLFDHPFGVRVNLGGRNGTNRNVVATMLFDFYTHYIGYLAPFGHNTQRDR